MSAFESLQNEINNLKIDASNDLMEVLNKLHDQFNRASNAKWSREELSEIIKSEDDVLDTGLIEEDTGLWEEIRSIQDGIINFFGEEKKD